MKEKKQQAEKITEIQNKVQELYFDLEEFKEFDTATASLTKAIELMDAIASIRKRILQGLDKPDSKVET